MRKSVAAMFVLVFSVASCLVVAKPAFSSAEVAENSWTTKTSMPSAVSGLRVAVVNDKIYAIAGNYNYEYNTATDTWTVKKSMPTSRFNFGMAVYQNKIYVIGGTIDYTWGRGPGIYYSANEAYDPATDTWETKAPMPTNRSEFQAIVVDGKIYCISGHTSFDWDKGEFQRCTKNEVYDPSADIWETKMPMPTEKAYFDANVVGNKIYCIGGIPDSANVVYDSSTDNWTKKASMPIPVYSYMSAVIDQKIYILAGGPSESDYNQIYDVQTDTWSSGKSLPSAVRSVSVAATTGTTAPRRIYVIGGGSRNYVYDPQADVWSTGASMPTPRSDPAVVVVNDMLYAIGGTVLWSDPITAVEQYTPFGYGTVPPSISVVSPENKTYNVTSVSLVFTVNKPAVWIGFSLDGQDNITITENTTLSGLSSGLHNVTVYAKDAFENMGASETVTFTIVKEPETFSIRLAAAVAIVVAAVMLVAAVGIGLSAYLKKRK